MSNVSTGEPDGQWKGWIKWLRLLGVLVAGIWLQKLWNQDIVVLLMMTVVLVVMLARLRLTEQRLDLLIDRHPVQLNLYTDPSRRVWLESRSDGVFERCRITDPYYQGWLDHTLTLRGRPYRLRIFVKTYGCGYMVSNYERGFEMRVLRNTCVW
ncbi:hypothetical protein [Massilia sp. IC2-476]|uniref:hypothetical protein n=1 Tax=Massilia sp. IC2-476 TaxID=2887199 RepID=UPI001D11F8F8|nr:hypothetical protein [Massilia sp. IC2-476]MCC2974221.1 hypothetical protein [Massilia sp. IC2-476]